MLGLAPAEKIEAVPGSRTAAATKALHVISANSHQLMLLAAGRAALDSHDSIAHEGSQAFNHKT